MEDLSAYMIDTRIVYGFQGAGKTSYISDCIENDFFHKRGTTLILCLEQGKEQYNEEALCAKKTHVAVYEGSGEIRRFCTEQMEIYKPDRIYVEMNTKYPSAREQLPESMKVTSVVTLIDWTTLDRYMDLFRQRLSQMVTESMQITFRGCPSKELLAPYSKEFRLMNHRASYLRQDPMGYHEKAFDLFVPYPLDTDTITISEREYLIFWLDAMDHPEHYEGKALCFSDPLELRSSDHDRSAGRVVMTCCMADLQFMAFELTGTGETEADGGWITMKAIGRIGTDAYGGRKLKLEPEHLEAAAPPEGGTILKTALRKKGTSLNISKLKYRGI